MAEQQIQNSFSLDRFTGMQKGKLTFPSLYLESDEYMDQFAILFDSIPSGTLPVVIGIESKLVEVGKVPKDMTTIMRLAKYFKCGIILTQDYVLPINEVEDLYDDRIDWS